MTKLPTIRRLAKLVMKVRQEAEVHEEYLRIMVDEEIEQGNGRGFAKAIGVSQQYLSDIRKGRRKLSNQVIEALGGLRIKPSAKRVDK